MDARTLAVVVGKLLAGNVEHFSEVSEATDADAALAAGIFHRKEVAIAGVKEHLGTKNLPVR